MAKQTPQAPPRAISNLDGSWVVDSDEDYPTGEGYDLRSGPSGVRTMREISVDSVASDSGEGFDSLQIPATTSSQSSNLTYAGSSRQLPHAAELGDTARKKPARGGITAYADPDVEESSETAVNLSRPKSLKGKALGQSKRSRRSSGTKEEKKDRASPRTPAEQDLIMPSFHEDGLRSSWFDGGNPRRRKGTSRGTNVPVESEGADRIENFGLRNIAPSTHVQPATISDSLTAFLKSVVTWLYDITRGALGKLKTPLSYFLAVYLFFGLLIFFRNLITSSVYSALSPICRIPGASLLSLPMCYSKASVQYQGDEPPPVQFDQLMNVQSKFEAVLEESAGGASLPLDMKRSETSIRDLRQVVRYSNLHSKNELVLEFDGFVETARIASFDLQKFNSHIGRGVDSILATARWTKRVLEGIALRDSSKGAIMSFFYDKFLTPFQPLKFTEDTLLNQYVQYTRVVEQEIQRLIDEAQALLRVLQNLEDRLDVIHGIAVRDDLHAQSSRAEVLSHLWTTVGGNRNELRKFNSQLRLLGQVNTYRQSAIAHVSGTMIKLQGMGAELEELRERVGGVELLGGSRGVPLSVHIENIELGVERLENGRNSAKRVENEQWRKTLERGKKGTKEIEGV